MAAGRPRSGERLRRGYTFSLSDEADNILNELTADAKTSRSEMVCSLILKEKKNKERREKRNG